MSIGAPYRHDNNVEEYTTTVMDGNLTLKLEDADIMHLDGDGTRNVTLPALAMGAKVTIVNSGGEQLTVLNPGLTTTNGVVTTLEVGVFYCDGTTWNHMTGVA